MKETPATRAQALFDHMSCEHGLTLLDAEMHEIELIVSRMLDADREREAALPIDRDPATMHF